MNPLRRMVSLALAASIALPGPAAARVLSLPRAGAVRPMAAPASPAAASSFAAPLSLTPAALTPASLTPSADALRPSLGRGAPTLEAHSAPAAAAAPAPTAAAAPAPTSPARLVVAAAAPSAITAIAPQPLSASVPLRTVQAAWTQRDGRDWPFEGASRPTSASLVAANDSDTPAPYGLRPALHPRARKVMPTPDQVARARAAYLRFAAEGEEIFDAPTLVEKTLEPGLKAAFGVAKREDTLIDFANGVEATLPPDVKGDPIETLVALRTAEYRAYREARARYDARRQGRGKAYAIKSLEALHRAGLVAPALENEPDAALADLKASYARLRDMALGTAEPKLDEVLAAMRELTAVRARLTTSSARELKPRVAALARAADDIMAARAARASPEEAKSIYERSLRRGKDAADPQGVRHSLARFAAMRAGSLRLSPYLGRQLRPTCTLHMLRGLLIALGVRKDMPTLVKEARALLGDPFVGATTSFDDALQLRLFRHYGVSNQVTRSLFATQLASGKSMKIRIEIGDPVYKHSLILEGFYELDGRLYASLRDSTSDFPTHMEIAELAAVLTEDPAVILTEPRRAGIPR